MVDDGSSDSSTDIAKEYARCYPDKIRYVEHPGHLNKGVCATRNLGIRNAGGELVCFLDADDVWTKEKLSRQIEIALRHPDAAMICEASVYWNSWQNPEKEDKIIYVGIDAGKVYYPPQLALNLYPLKRVAAPCPSGILIRRETLEKIGGFEESFVGQYYFYEDQAFLFKVYLNAPVFVSADCNNYYRLHDKSAMAMAKEKPRYKQIGRHFFFKWARKYVRRQKIKNKELDKLIDQALAAYRYLFLKKVWKIAKTALTK